MGGGGLAGARGETLTADTAAAWRQAEKRLAEAEIVVDALLGTGSRGAPRGVVAAAIEALERLDAFIVSVDIPSGLDADTGGVPGACVHADLTVTLALPKRGLYLYPGRAFVGELSRVDLGFPADVLEAGAAGHVQLVEPEDVAERLPGRDPEMHKGDRGRLLVVGGSPGLTGAVALAARAAVRAGAGLVTAGVPARLQHVMAVKLTEAMSLALPESENGVLGPGAPEAVMAFQPGQLTALALGPGAGRHPETRAAVRDLVARLALPTVLDADGLMAFAGEADLLSHSAAGRGLVLTPHPGEFAALTGEPLEEIQASRPAAAARWAGRLGAVIVLKGAPTVIADPGGDVYVNPTGNEALATGGTGDVLTGFLAGFLAQGLDPVDAAVAAVYLHGWIAEYVVDDWGSIYGLQAGDLIDYFPAALGDFLSPPEAEEKPRPPLR